MRTAIVHTFKGSLSFLFAHLTHRRTHLKLEGDRVAIAQIYSTLQSDRSGSTTAGK
jgi:hypothetical protein